MLHTNTQDLHQARAAELSRHQQQLQDLHEFYRGELAEPIFGPSSESLEVALFSEDDIPWDELAFPVIELALNYFLEDRKTGQFTVKHDEIRRPWKSQRTV